MTARINNNPIQVRPFLVSAAMLAAFMLVALAPGPSPRAEQTAVGHAEQEIAVRASGEQCFSRDGILEFRRQPIPRVEVVDPTVSEFIPGVRVDDGISPEHREPVVVWGPGGMIYAAYCERATHYNPELVMFTRSEDGGFNWLAPAIQINDTAPNAAMFPAIDIMSDGTIVVVWTELKFAPYNDEIRFSRSLDGGDSWSPSVVIHPINPSIDYIRPSILVVGDRTLVSFWQAVNYPNGYVLSIYSDDGGTTWSDPVTITYTMGRYDGAAACLAYNEELDKVGVVMSTINEQIYFCHSADIGESWSDPVQVNDVPAGSVDYPDLDCGQGFFHVVWYDNRYGQSNCDIFTSRSENGQTFSPSIMVNDPFVGNQYEPHIRLGGDGKIHVCWIWNMPFESNIDLYYSVSEDGGNSWLQPCPRVNDIAYVVQPYVAWTSDLLADALGDAYLFWNDGRLTDYYDSIYFSRTIDWGGIEDGPGRSSSEGLLGTVALSVSGQPGPSPTLHLRLEQAAPDARLELIDANGRMVSLATLGHLDAGTHLFPLWDSVLGQPLPWGAYFVRLRAGPQTATRRVIRVR